MRMLSQCRFRYVPCTVASKPLAHVYVYIYIYIMYMYMYMYMSMYMYMYMYMYIHIHRNVCICISVYIYIYSCVYVYIDIYAVAWKTAEASSLMPRPRSHQNGLWEGRQFVCIRSNKAHGETVPGSSCSGSYGFLFILMSLTQGLEARFRSESILGLCS